MPENSILQAGSEACISSEIPLTKWPVRVLLALLSAS
jgi:hypothetical protein